MNSTIRKITEADRKKVVDLMREFYTSPAVLSNGSEEIFQNNVNNCLDPDCCLDGFVVEEAGIIQGYVMIIDGYATEFGKRCIWIEDLYLKEPYRNRGIGSYVLQSIMHQFPGCIFRLEVEEENTHAVAAYKKHGFEFLPYQEMIAKP